MLISPQRSGGTLRVPDTGREASRPYNRIHPPEEFLRDHQICRSQGDKNPKSFAAEGGEI